MNFRGTLLTSWIWVGAADLFLVASDLKIEHWTTGIIRAFLLALVAFMVTAATMRTWGPK